MTSLPPKIIFDPQKLPDFYDELPLWSAPFGLRLLEQVVYRPHLTALDIGFGTGFPLLELAMRLGTTAKIYGLDPWHEGFARVRQKMAYYSISNVTLMEGVAEAIPLDSGSVDLIVSNNGLNNVQDLDRSLSECARVLKPGGQMVLTMNTDLSMRAFYAVLEDVLRDFGLGAYCDSVQAHIHQKRPSLKPFLSKLEQHGFGLRDVTQDQFSYRFADATAMFGHYFIRLAFLPSWIGLVPQDHVAAVFGEIESRLNARSQVLGGLQLGIPFVMINARRG